MLKINHINKIYFILTIGILFYVGFNLGNCFAQQSESKSINQKQSVESASSEAQVTPELKNFFDQISNLMNQRNREAFTKFYKYYSDPSAVFIKQSEFIDNDSPQNALDEEKLKLNREEYIKYLGDILEPLGKYQYLYRISKVENISDTISYVTIDSQENMTRRIADKKDGILKLYYLVSNMRCIYSLNKQNAQLVITSMNCVERINKTLVKSE